MSSWNQPRFGNGSKQSLKNDHLKLDLQRPIWGNLTWITITFVSNMRTISKFQVPPGWIVPHLQPHSSVALSASDRLSTSAATKAPLQSRGQNLKPSFGKTLEILRPSSTTSGVSLERTFSTSWKRPKTGYHTSSTSNQSWRSLIMLEPQMNWPWSAIFGKTSNPLSRLKWNSRIKHQLASKRWYRGQSTQKLKQT